MASSSPHCLEAYKNGFVYASKNGELTYVTFINDEPKAEAIAIKSPGVGGNFSIKAVDS